MNRLVLHSLFMILSFSGFTQPIVANDTNTGETVDGQPAPPSVIVYQDFSLKKEGNRCEVEVQPILSKARGVQSLLHDVENEGTLAKSYRLKITVPNSIGAIEVITQPTDGNELATQISLDSSRFNADKWQHQASNAATGEPRPPVALAHQQFGMKNQFFEIEPTRNPSNFLANPFYQSKFEKSKRRIVSQETPDTSTPAISITRLPKYEEDFQLTPPAQNSQPVPPFHPTSVVQTVRHATPIAMELPNFLVQTAISGPRSMELGDTSDFEIVITNASQASIENVLVQLQIPAGFEVLQLGQKAWMGAVKREGEAKFLSWQVGSLPAGKSERFKYSLHSHLIGEQVQKVTANADNLLIGESQIPSTVTPAFAQDADLSAFGR